MPIVYVVRAKVIDNRTIWGLINPKYKEYNFILVDKAINSNTDQLYKIARKAIGKPDSKINIMHNNDEN